VAFRTQERFSILVAVYNKKGGYVREGHEFVQRSNSSKPGTGRKELIDRFIQEEEVVTDSDGAKTIT
jgi:hypothetical protein